MRKGEPGEYVWERDGALMVYVPGGSFRMGRDDAQPEEGPAHRVTLDPYYIDKFEVTNRQWKLSGLTEAKRASRSMLPPLEPPWGLPDDLPMVYASHNDAREYLAWAGRRLPTEAEWEYAARGGDGRAYPWGDGELTHRHANFGGHERQPTPGGRFPLDRSWCGAMDMGGNVWEWCDDWFDSSFYGGSPEHNPHLVKKKDFPYDRVIRGGHWDGPPAYVRTSSRYSGDPVLRLPYFGFRGAISSPHGLTASGGD